MRGMFLDVALAVLVTIAGSPARANHHAPVSGEPAYADPPSQVVAQWPPTHPDGASEMHFRGKFRGKTTLQVDGQSRAGVGLVADRYFINADSSDRVIVTNVDGDRVRLDCPGEWEGAGVLTDSTYWGVFVYRDDAREPRNRGARGTHLGTLESSGRLRISGTFTNRKWPEFESTWTPVDATTGTRDDGDSVQRIDLERLSEVPVVELLEHPVWSPEQRWAPGPDFGHPVWPPEWFKGDRRIMLAAEADVDVLPEVTRRVEPSPEGGDRDHSVAAEGLVVVRALVDRDGAVIDVRIARSVPALDGEALRAVRRWHFRPAKRQGWAVPAPVYVPVRFAPR